MMMAVSFEQYGRLYYLDPGGCEPKIGDRVLVPTDGGPEVPLAYGVVAFGDPARTSHPVAAQWLSELNDIAAPVWSISGDPAEVNAELPARLSSSMTGLRLMVVGSEQEVLGAASIARAATAA